MRESEAGTDAAFDKKLSAGSGKWKLSVIFMLAGLVVGAALTALIRLEGARAMVVTVGRGGHHDVGRTCEALRTSLEVQGFNCRAIRNLNKSMAKRGVQVDRQRRVVQFGSAGSAHDMSALMACAFGVYEGNDASLCISSTNQMLMGKMFGGTVAGFMGG